MSRSKRQYQEPPKGGYQRNNSICSVACLFALGAWCSLLSDLRLGPPSIQSTREPNVTDQL